jgi:hypothetical protein
MIVKVRNPLWDQRHRYAAGVIQEFAVYEGSQLTPPKFAEPGTICLSTGKAGFPVREIHPASIVSIDDKPVVRKQAAQETRVVEIKGSKGNTYRVTIGPNGRACDCTGFKFRRACRHISEAA